MLTSVIQRVAAVARQAPLAARPRPHREAARRGWCRSTSTTTSASSPRTARPPTSPSGAAPASRGWPRAAPTRAPRTLAADGAGADRHLGPAVHRPLPRAVPVPPPGRASTCGSARFVEASDGVTRRATSTATSPTTSPARTASTSSATTSTRRASRRHRARADAGAGARRLPSGASLDNVERLRAISASTRCRSTCRAPRR